MEPLFLLPQVKEAMGMQKDLRTTITPLFMIQDYIRLPLKELLILRDRQKFKLQTGGKFFCEENMNGWVHIQKIDTINKFISGEFEFDAVNENDPKDTIYIRKGRFDCKFIY